MAHIHEKIDFTADIFIVYTDKVLLRMHDKYHVWLTPGGHIELHEDPTEAAAREVKEEVGLDVTLWSGHSRALVSDEHVRGLVPPVYMNRHAVSPTHEHVSMVYFATTDTDQVQPGKGEQQDGWKWFTKEELQTADIPKNIRDYALLALEQLGEK